LGEHHVPILAEFNYKQQNAYNNPDICECICCLAEVILFHSSALIDYQDKILVVY